MIERFILLIFVLAITLLSSTSTGSGFYGNNFRSSTTTGRGGGPTGGDTEYYDILGVTRDSNEQDIKKAFRALAMKLHPDKGGDTEKFKKLNEAYEVLSDKTKRAAYDRFGKAGQGTAYSGQPDFGDLFGSFGSFSIPLMYTIELSLEDLYKGRKINVEVSGQELQIDVEPGMYDGLEMRAQVVDRRGIIRDVVFVIQEKAHSTFKRLNADLYMELKLSLKESLLGFERTITHLDGTTFTVKSEEGEVTAMDDTLVLENLGMPIYSPRRQLEGRGRLFIKTKVELPSSLWLKTVDKAALARLLPGAHSNTQKSGSKLSIGGAKPPLVTGRKGDLEDFGQAGKPPRRSNPFGDGANFSSFFFR